MIALLFALLTVAPQTPDSGHVAVDPATAVAPDTHQETQLERDTRQLASELRCPVCQGLSLQDSPSELSQEMRAIITEQLKAGKSVDEVKQYFIEKYGEWILLKPEPHGFNLTVYIAPILLLLGGGLLLWRTAKKWTKQGSAAVNADVEEDETAAV